MKTLEELGISPAPWTQGDGPADDFVFDAGGKAVAESVYERNARLIAAAPDLYEALREIYETVEGENVHFTGASAWFDKARAALDKAGGAK